MTVYFMNPNGNGERTITLPASKEEWKRLGPSDAPPPKPQRSYIWWYEGGQLQVKYLDEFKDGEKIEVPPYGGACFHAQAE